MQAILDDIKTSIDILARKINAPHDLMPLCWRKNEA